MRSHHFESVFQSNAIVSSKDVSETSGYSEDPLTPRSRIPRRTSLPVKRRPSVAGMRALAAAVQRRFPHFQQRRNRLHHLVYRHCFHAAKIDRAFSQEAGTAFDLMTDYVTGVSERAGEVRFRRTKDSDDRNPEDRSEVHRAGV